MTGTDGNSPDSGRPPAETAPGGRPDTMPTRPYDPWRDAHGTPIPLHCRIEQVAVGKGHGALSSRLHKQGEVLGRGVTRLNIRFDGEATVVSIRPHLVRVLTTPGGC